MAETGSPDRADPPRYTAGNLPRESEIEHRGPCRQPYRKLSADRSESTVTLQSGDSFWMDDEQGLRFAECGYLVQVRTIRRLSDGGFGAARSARRRRTG
jgi:hypothetical protein